MKINGAKRREWVQWYVDYGGVGGGNDGGSGRVYLHSICAVIASICDVHGNSLLDDPKWRERDDDAFIIIYSAQQVETHAPCRTASTSENTFMQFKVTLPD